MDIRNKLLVLTVSAAAAATTHSAIANSGGGSSPSTPSWDENCDTSSHISCRICKCNTAWVDCSWNSRDSVYELSCACCGIDNGSPNPSSATSCPSSASSAGCPACPTKVIQGNSCTGSGYNYRITPSSSSNRENWSTSDNDSTTYTSGTNARGSYKYVCY